MIDTERNVLDDLAEIEAKLAKFEGEQSEYATRAFAAKKRIQQLTDQANALARKDPELTDEHGNPVSKSNPVGKIRAELAKVEDPDDLKAKKDHAERIAQKYRWEYEAFIADHFEAIHRARLARAAEVRDGVRSLRDGHLKAARDYLNFAHQSVHLTGPHPEYTGRDVGGIDEVSDLIRVLEQLEDLPLPTVNGYAQEIPDQGDHEPGESREGEANG